MSDDILTDDTEVMQQDGEFVDDSFETEIDIDIEADDVDWRAEALKYKNIAKRQAKKLSAPQPEAAAPKVVVKKEVVNTPVPEEQISSLVEAKLMQRDLDSLDLSDTLRTEVKKYAELNNVSVKAAASSDYIQFLKDKEVAKARAEEASISSQRTGQPRADFTDANPADFDLSTKEGREEWAAYKKYLKNS